jgi:hypothetical protein
MAALPGRSWTAMQARVARVYNVGECYTPGRLEEEEEVGRRMRRSWMAWTAAEDAVLDKALLRRPKGQKLDDLYLSMEASNVLPGRSARAMQARMYNRAFKGSQASKPAAEEEEEEEEGGSSDGSSTFSGVVRMRSARDAKATAAPRATQGRGGGGGGGGAGGGRRCTQRGDGGPGALRYTATEGCRYTADGRQEQAGGVSAGGDLRSQAQPAGLLQCLTLPMSRSLVPAAVEPAALRGPPEGSLSRALPRTHSLRRLRRFPRPRGRGGRRGS